MSLLFARRSRFDVVSVFETENLAVRWRSRIGIFCLSTLVRCDSSLDGPGKSKKGAGLRTSFEFHSSESKKSNKNANEVDNCAKTEGYGKCCV
jgi:hypothetical protein